MNVSYYGYKFEHIFLDDVMKYIVTNCANCADVMTIKEQDYETGKKFFCSMCNLNDKLQEQHRLDREHSKEWQENIRCTCVTLLNGHHQGCEYAKTY